MRRCEVAVVGAGIVGAATAWELHARGVDVCLLDAGDVSGGTTGLGEGNVLCSDKEPGPGLELAIHGRTLFDEIEARYGAVAEIRRKGALVVHLDEATWTAEPERVARLGAAGVEGGLVGPEEVRALEPALTGELFGASYFPGDLQCAPRAITRALAAEIPRVVTHCRVEEIVVEGGRVKGVGTAAETRGGGRVKGVRTASRSPGGAGRVTGLRTASRSPGGGGRVTGLRTAAGTLAADAVVIAAGPWSAPLAATAGLHLPVEPRWGQLVQLRAPAGDRLVRHKVLDASYLASVVDPGAGLQITTVVETTSEGDVLVGSSRARRGFDDTVDPAVSEAMVNRAVRLFPTLQDLAPARAWSGLRPWLPDHLPAIGPSRAAEGLWVATGHEGAGVALGPVTGRLVARALCGEPTLLDLAPFDPDRFTPRTRP